MSMPNIPNITPEISLDRCEVINLLLSSIALEEIGLSHILNAEGEKLQCFLKTEPHCREDFLKINNSINKTLRTIVKSQMLLQFKLEDVVSLSEESNCNRDHKHCDTCHHHQSCEKECPHCHSHDCCTCQREKSDCE